MRLSPSSSGCRLLTHLSGGLSQATGDAVCKRVNLLNCWGSSEIGALVYINIPSSEWQYLGLDPYYNGLEFRPVEAGDDAGPPADSTNGQNGTKPHANRLGLGDDVYEIVVVRTPEAEPYQRVWHSFPDEKEWPTNDLCSKHPTLPNVWKIIGRQDDLICYGNGLKTHPAAFETEVLKSPLIAGALLSGTERLQPVLLVELAPGTADSADVRSKVWQCVQKVNAMSQSHTQVAETHILFTQSDKPFLKAEKGTVQRGRTLNEYDAAIDEVYEKSGDRAFDMHSRWQN